MTREGAVQVVKLQKLGVPGAAACCASCEALLRKLTNIKKRQGLLDSAAHLVPSHPWLCLPECSAELRLVVRDYFGICPQRQRELHEPGVLRPCTAGTMTLVTPEASSGDTLLFYVPPPLPLFIPHFQSMCVCTCSASMAVRSVSYSFTGSLFQSSAHVEFAPE